MPAVSAGARRDGHDPARAAGAALDRLPRVGGAADHTIDERQGRVRRSVSGRLGLHDYQVSQASTRSDYEDSRKGIRSRGE
jgi:hypothetical protein